MANDLRRASNRFYMARCRNFSEVAVLKTVRVLLKLKYLDIGQGSDFFLTIRIITCAYCDKFSEQLVA